MAARRFMSFIGAFEIIMNCANSPCWMRWKLERLCQTQVSYKTDGKHCMILLREEMSLDVWKRAVLNESVGMLKSHESVNSSVREAKPSVSVDIALTVSWRKNAVYRNPRERSLLDCIVTDTFCSIWRRLILLHGRWFGTVWLWLQVFKQL